MNTLTQLSQGDVLALICLLLMAAAMLAYVLLDGFDLGVGVLLRRADDVQKDTLISAIGPFWDANETWLVLGVGLLLVAFPKAHGAILGALYLPVLLMLVGLMARGVAFELRQKVEPRHKFWADRVFYMGSLLASLSQGYMVGRYVLGFEQSWLAYGFALVIAPCLLATYVLLGASWLIIKTEGALQGRAIAWAQGALLATGVGVLLISLATPYASQRIFEKWFALPNFIALAPIPLATAALFGFAYVFLRRLKQDSLAASDKGLHRWCWAPFVCAASIVVLAFLGLAFSVFPYLVIDQLTVFESAIAPGSLKLIVLGALVTLPIIVAYNLFAYRVFWGKAQPLNYHL